MFPDDLAAVIFDAGGTLVQLDYAWISRRAAGHGQAISQLELQRSEAAARRAVDQQSDDRGAATGSDASRLAQYFANLMAGTGIPPASSRAIAAEMETEHGARNLWRVPMPGAEETLRGLRERGVPAAVVSNADGRVEAGLVEVGLGVHLELVIDSHEEGVEKPDPEIFHRALRRLDKPAERCVYIGDIYSIDAVGARAAGLYPVIIDPIDSYGQLDCPKIADLRELLTAVDRARG